MPSWFPDGSAGEEQMSLRKTNLCVLSIDNGHRFVKRRATWQPPEGKAKLDPPVIEPPPAQFEPLTAVFSE